MSLPCVTGSAMSAGRSVTARGGFGPAGTAASAKPMLQSSFRPDRASVFAGRVAIASPLGVSGPPLRLSRKVQICCKAKARRSVPPSAAIRNSTGSWRTNNQDQWSTSHKVMNPVQKYYQDNTDVFIGGVVLAVVGAASVAYLMMTNGKKKGSAARGTVMDRMADVLKSTKASLSQDVNGIKRELLGGSSPSPRPAQGAVPRAAAAKPPARSSMSSPPATRGSGAGGNARPSTALAKEGGDGAMAELVSTQVVLPEIGELQSNIYDLFVDESLADLQFVVRSDQSKSILDQARSSMDGMDPKRLRSVTLQGSVDVSSIEALQNAGLLVGGTDNGGTVPQGSKGWEVVKAHKLVVAAASDPLRRVILETEKLAASASTGPNGLEIILEGTPVWALKAVLEFAYTGRARARAGNVIELAAVARQLEMLPLESLCTKWLISRLDVNNCALWITLSELLQLPEVHAATFNFAPAHFEQVAQTESFLGLNLGLMAKLIGDDKVYAPSGEEAVFEALLRWLERTPDKERFEAAKELLPLVRFPLMRSESLVMLQAQVQEGNVPVVNEMASLLQPLLLEAAMFQMATQKQKLQLTAGSPGLSMRVARRRGTQDSSGWAVGTVLAELQGNVAGAPGGAPRQGSRMLGQGGGAVEDFADEAPAPSS